jgi:hypothetical protein
LDTDLYNRLRKRMLMFYFAAGINIVMALWVASAGAGQVPGGTLAAILLAFVGFAGLNFYMARVLKRQWDAHLRQHGVARSDEVKQ